MKRKQPATSNKHSQTDQIEGPAERDAAALSAMPVTPVESKADSLASSDLPPSTTDAICFSSETQVRSIMEQRYREVFDHSSDGILFVDVLESGRFKCAGLNPAAERITRVANAQASGRYVDEIFPKDFAGALLVDCWRCLDGGNAVSHDITVESDTDELELSTNLVPIKGGDGRVRRVVCVIRDITEANRSKARLAQQAALLDMAREAISAHTLDSRVIYWNKGAERLYGWTAEEVMGKDIASFGYPEETLPVLKKARELVESTGEWHGDFIQVSKDMRSIIAETRFTLVPAADRKPACVLSIQSDVTDKKWLEQQSIRMERLEGIATLAGGIAHDLNNVFAPILLSAAMLKIETGPKEIAHLAETIDRCAQRGADIVRQVLVFAGGAEATQAAVQLRHLVDSVLKSITDVIPRSITIKTDIPSDLWPVEANPGEIHQVFLNLCRNSCEAMPNGGVLTISAENVVLDEASVHLAPNAKPGPRVKVSVTDSGVGIPPEIVDKIFEPFFSTKETYKGAGLGLSTVLGIIKSHDGFVKVYSEVGHGTTVHFYLSAMPSDQARSEIDNRTLPRGSGELLLLVEDELPLRKMIESILQVYGYNVISAGDGVEALALFMQKGGAIKTVITDMVMPRMDGGALIRELKQLDPGIKIVAISGLASNRTNLENIGAQHFLLKPCTTDQLLTTVEKALKGV